MTRELTFLLVVIYLFAAYLQLQLPFNFDVSWLLHVTERLLQGGNYVKDFFEINPPLILYFYAPAVLVAKIFPLDKLLIFQIYIFLWVTLALYFCHILSNKTFLTVAIATVFLIFPVYEFGQREHLLLAFSLPYFLLLAARCGDVEIKYSQALLIGLLAGLGFALKPFFVIVFVLLEIFFVCYRRSLFAWYRVEVLAVLIVIFCYAAVVLLFQSDYVFVVVPYALRLYHDGYGYPLTAVLAYTPALFCCLVLLFFSLRLRSGSNLQLILWLGLVGFLAAYFVQHTVLYSHVLPSFATACLLLTLFFVEFVTKKDTGLGDYIVASLLATLCAVFLAYKVRFMWIVLIFQPHVFFGFFAALFLGLFYYLQGKKNFLKILFVLAIIFSLALPFAYWAGHTSWYAHCFALTVLLLIMLFGVFASRVKNSQPKNMFSVALACLMFAFPVYFINKCYVEAVTYKASLQPLIEFLKKSAQGQPVYFFTATTVYQFPAVDYARALPAGRTGFLGWLPGVLSAPTRTMVDKNFFINMITEDLNTKKPLYVFIDVSKNKSNLNMPFEFLPYFTQDSHFQSAWREYGFVTTLENKPFYQFEVYKRKK